MSTMKTGWIEFKDRTEEMNANHEKFVGSMHKFRIMGDAKSDTNKIILTDFWKHPQVVAALGYAFPRFHQLTGSCVGAGGGNCLFTLMAIEVIRLGQAEQIKLPFWLYTYGKSRQRGGIRGEGEGSFGSAYAEAAKLDGYIDIGFEDTPDPTQNDGLVYTSNLEFKWSNGAAIASKYNQEAKKHLVKSTSPVSSAEEARESIMNGFPITIATDYYIGSAQIKGSGDNKAAIGKLNGRGGHQTSIQAFWDNPDLGLIFGNQNNWDRSVYPKDPGGLGDSACWMSESDMNYACKNGEVYAFSQFDGFPAQRIDKMLFRVMG